MASPRISFSQGVINASISAEETQRADGSLPLDQTADFNFTICHQIPPDHSSNADELFSNGKILPFFKKPNPAENKPAGPQPRLIIDSSTGSGDEKPTPGCDLRGNCRLSFWRFGRSSSVGSVVDHGPIFPLPLNRCKSTGSFPNPARRQPQVTNVRSIKLRSDSNQRKIYYFSGSKRGSHGGGVRINPIINLPAKIVATGGSGGGGGGGGSNGAIAGIFAYLLCNCGGEEKRGEIRDFLAASPQNGREIVGYGRR